MQFVKVPVTTLEILIEGLENAIRMCNNVDETSGKSEKSYAYAVGYCKGSMESITDQIKYLKSQAE